MYHTIEEFIKDWNREASLTQLVMNTLTDESLDQQFSENTTRDLGKLAWHIAAGIPDYLSHFGLKIEQVENSRTMAPISAKEIAETFNKVREAVVETIREQWSDEVLSVVREAFGRQLSNAEILGLLIKHMIHHRGQMTVLIRQADLKSPIVYGPALEDWNDMGVPAPLI